MGGTFLAELERLADAMEAEEGTPAQISLPSVAARVAKNLGVREDEVAILHVSPRRRNLQFLVPEKLRNVGNIPLSSVSSLAARTARESRPEIVNKFASVAHATVFEGVPLEGGERSEPIQKIISAPILSGDIVIGVMQVSRKGRNAKKAGPDFTADDLGKVLALCRPLAKILHRLGLE